MQCPEVTPLEVSHATVQDLPHELIVDIITIVAAAVSTRAETAHWLQLRLVCRDWNSLACSTASLWKHIRAYPKVSIEWLLLCLERSGQAPLDILFYELPQETLEELLPLLSQPENTHRIRSLRVEWLSVCTPLLALFHLPLPSLEKLEVYVVHWPGLDENSIPVSFPRLHTLKLTGVPIPKDPAIYADLRSLGLHRGCCAHRDHQPALADLVAVLKFIHRLETLDLSEFTPCNIAASELRNADASLHLPYLRTYTIRNTTPVLSSINRLLSFPMTCAVNVSIADIRGIEWNYESSHAAISDAMGPCIHRMLENATAMTVCSDDRRFDVLIPADPEGSRAPPSPRVEILHRTPLIPGVPLPRFGDFVPFCPSDRLTHLTFESICGTYSVPKWAAILRAYPTLRSITITRAACDVSRMICALTPLGPGHLEDRQELLCPDLRSIHLTLYTRQNKVLYSIGRSLVACATARAERSARPLESFTAIWSTSWKEPVLPENPVWEDLVGRLRGLVDQVDISARSF